MLELYCFLPTAAGNCILLHNPEPQLKKRVLGTSRYTVLQGRMVLDVILFLSFIPSLTKKLFFKTTAIKFHKKGADTSALAFPNTKAIN